MFMSQIEDKYKEHLWDSRPTGDALDRRIRAARARDALIASRTAVEDTAAYKDARATYARALALFKHERDKCLSEARERGFDNLRTKRFWRWWRQAMGLKKPTPSDPSIERGSYLRVTWEAFDADPNEP